MLFKYKSIDLNFEILKIKIWKELVYKIIGILILWMFINLYEKSDNWYCMW